MLGVRNRLLALDLDIAVSVIADRHERGEPADIDDAIRQRKSGIAALKAFNMGMTPSRN
ncbi:hypothetical protein LLH00_05975 [bacterium]|nr:hypothetical protein [bacterium]